MPHYFLDTSALVKHYHTEPGSLRVDQILGEAGSAYLIAKYGKTRQIHTLDAIQLAVALSIQAPAPIDHFVCSDQRLCNIALIEGLAVINPEPKLWQGLLTLPLRRPKVSNPDPAGDLRCGRRRGLETRAEQPPTGRPHRKVREDAADSHPRRDSARCGLVDSDARPDRSFRLLRSKTLQHRLARGTRGNQS